MTLRQRLQSLELLVKPPTPVCTRDRTADSIGDFIRAKHRDVEAQKRLDAWKKPAECTCDVCEKERRRMEADPECQEIHRFLVARYGSGAIASL